uniref:Proline rich 35 n=1 Tax=Xiphophorus maculatus TaxID=8083 RepID=M3ZCZ0_XIPMA
MSKDEACKVTSAGKHKERKPKKPHYIPRPWGKPYNYKCFQCPFTCMEKSHLYNHMKYSLCKNSLSLLIESDWPYKKGNILHPDQLRPFQQAHGLHAAGKEELEQLRHYKLPKTCLASPGLLSEQWRLFASSHSKAKAEGAQQRVSGSIPCYPPPTNLVDYQDPGGLNLSVLGVGYPISPSWLSYMNSAIPTGASSVAAQTHAQFTQLPFLASAAQLVHPASSTQTDRALIPPRLYYPFLCEHTFGPASAQSDAGKSLKTPSSSVDSSALSGYQPKVGLWKVPALRPGNTASPAGWVSPQRDSLDQGYRGGEKIQATAKEGKVTCGLKRTGGPIRGPESPKTAAAENVTNLFSNLKLLSVAALLTDLSKALQQYQEAERKISHLEKEDLPAQRPLWEHLNKIRSELSHIHQALERTAGQSDGPLDLSVKKESTDSPGEQTVREDGSLRGSAMETEEEDEEAEEEKSEKEEEDESEGKLIRASLEKRKQSLDMLIKMSQVSVVNTEVLPPGGVGLRSAEALWPSRTTKCEADSSVLLCPDGRSVVFTDIPTSVKPPKRPSSIQRLEAQCPPSPLTPPDS